MTANGSGDPFAVDNSVVATVTRAMSLSPAVPVGSDTR
jgi:hypothetical protein